MKEIPGFNDYSIDVAGEVFSKKSNKYLKIQANTSGYKFVRLHENGRQISLLIHRLLAFVYLNLPSLASTLEVDHKDDNRKNNALDNLQVITHEAHYLKTHGSYNIRRCGGCDTKISGNNVTELCINCYNEVRINDTITAEQIIYWVTNYSWSRASRELGLSDNGLRKRFKKLTGLNPKEIHATVV